MQGMILPGVEGQVHTYDSQGPAAGVSHKHLPVFVLLEIEEEEGDQQADDGEGQQEEEQVSFAEFQRAGNRRGEDAELRRQSVDAVDEVDGVDDVQEDADGGDGAEPAQGVKAEELVGIVQPDSGSQVHQRGCNLEDELVARGFPVQVLLDAQAEQDGQGNEKGEQGDQGRGRNADEDRIDDNQGEDGEERKPGEAGDRGLMQFPVLRVVEQVVLVGQFSEQVHKDETQESGQQDDRYDQILCRHKLLTQM